MTAHTDSIMIKLIINVIQKKVSIDHAPSHANVIAIEVWHAMQESALVHNTHILIQQRVWQQKQDIITRHANQIQIVILTWVLFAAM